MPRTVTTFTPVRQLARDSCAPAVAPVMGDDATAKAVDSARTVTLRPFIA